MRNMTAILLAAGKSKRMGRSKPLLRLADKPVIHWSIEALLRAGLEHILVVLGPHCLAIIDCIQDFPATVIWNKKPGSDMAGSLKVGLQNLSDDTEKVLVSLIDHPLVSFKTIQTLIKASISHPDKIIIPAYHGRKGHPTLFPRSVVEEIYETATLRDIIHKDSSRIHLVEVRDAAILMDMDTPEDFHRAQQMIERRSKRNGGKSQNQKGPKKQTNPRRGRCAPQTRFWLQ